MKNYKIEITETFQRIIEVEAETAEEAISEVENKYADGRIELDYDHFKDFEIKEYKEDEE